MSTEPKKEVASIQASIAEQVLAKVTIMRDSGGLRIPENYAPENAIRVAWLILQDTVNTSKQPVLQACSTASIANALLKMVMMGLNPIKRQCSFIAYGTNLTCQREYQGTIAMAKRHGVVSVTGAAVFQGDVFEFVKMPDGSDKVTKHEQTLQTIDSGIVVAAYAIKTYEGGKTECKVMSMSQIRKAWAQGPTKGESPAHKNFPDEMAIKSVIGRLLKPDVNSSDDSDLFDERETGTINIDPKTADVENKINQNANKEQFSLDAPIEMPTVTPAPEAEKVEAPVQQAAEVPTQGGQVKMDF